MVLAFVSSSSPRLSLFWKQVIDAEVTRNARQSRTLLARSWLVSFVGLEVAKVGRYGTVRILHYAAIGAIIKFHVFALCKSWRGLI